MSLIPRRAFLRAATITSGGLLAGIASPVLAAPGRPRTVTPLSASIGVLALDQDPRAGAFGQFGAAIAFDIDANLNSIGADLGAAVALNTIEIDQPGQISRIEQTDLSVYLSNDNVSYTKVADFDFVKLDASIVLYNIAATARYVKVHVHFDDTAASLHTTNIQTVLRVLDRSAGAWLGAGGASWTHQLSIQVTNPTTATMYDSPARIPLSTLSGLPAASDHRDLRFATAGHGELRHYRGIDSFMVRIPEIAPGSSTTVIAYAGNTSAISVSAPEALQVEYGTKTLVEHSLNGYGGDLAPVRLVNGTLMLVGATSLGQGRGIHAKYSFDEGRTWSAPEPLIPPGARAGVTYDYPAGCHVDPVSGRVLLMFGAYYYFKPEQGSALDPANAKADLYVTTATTFSGGKPVFGAQQIIPGLTTAAGADVTYMVSYTSPVKLLSGRLLHPVAYAYRADGAFAVTVLRSDDGGTTWTQSPSELTVEGAGFESGATEAAIAQLSSGEVRMYLRQQSTEMKYHLAITNSTDDGVAWSALEDSNVMSTNTLPELTRDGSRLLLSWSGHNSFGARYYRNNLTLAYSTDEAESWRGYRDVLGRTRLSNPGWDSAISRIVEPHKIFADDDALLLAWTAKSVLLEDYERFLYRSHGAAEDFERTAGTGLPALNRRYWWQSANAGTIEVSSARSRRGTRSLRLADSAAEKWPTGASRLFPAVRRARVRFSVNAASLSNELYIGLQEGFGAHYNTHGSAFVLRVGTDGSVRYMDTDAYFVDRYVGWTKDDTSPATTSLGQFGGTGLFAFDYVNRSFGVDLTNPKTITGIDIVDNDATNRVQAGDIEIYVSNTNTSDWQLVTGWTFTKTGGLIELRGLHVQSRYVKVHQAFSDTAFTLVNKLDDLLRVITVEQDPSPTFRDFSTVTQLATDQWYDFVVDADLDTGAANVAINGTTIGSAVMTHPAEALAHFLLCSGAGTGTEVFLDEFSVQDLERGELAVSSTGQTRRTR